MVLFTLCLNIDAVLQASSCVLFSPVSANTIPRNGTIFLSLTGDNDWVIINAETSRNRLLFWSEWCQAIRLRVSHLRASVGNLLICSARAVVACLRLRNPRLMQFVVVLSRHLPFGERVEAYCVGRRAVSNLGLSLGGWESVCQLTTLVAFRGWRKNDDYGSSWFLNLRRFQSSPLCEIPQVRIKASLPLRATDDN